jgi:hypothetical protein
LEITCHVTTISEAVWLTKVGAATSGSFAIMNVFLTENEPSPAADDAVILN